MKHTGKYLKSAFWLLISNAGVAVLSFLATVVIARGLGVVAFGELNYIMSFVMIFSFIAKGGVGQMMNRELSQHPERTDEIFSGGVLLTTGLSLLAYILMGVVGYWIEPEPELRRGFLLMGLIFFGMVPVLYEWIYNSQIRGGAAAVARLGACGIASLGKVICVQQGGGITCVLALTVAEKILTGVLLLLMRPGVRLRLFSVNCRVESRRLLSGSLYLLFSAAALLIYQKIDQIMLRHMASIEEVGQYAVATKFFVLLNLIPLSLSKALGPGLFKAKTTRPLEYLTRVQLLTDACVWGTLLPSLAIFSLSAWIVPALFGEAYSMAILLTRITVGRAVFSALGFASGQWILAENLQRFAPARTLAGMLVNILLNYLWIPGFGGVGAAWATLCGFAIANVLFHLFVPALRPVFFVQLRALFFGLPNLLFVLRREVIDKIRK